MSTSRPSFTSDNDIENKLRAILYDIHKKTEGNKKSANFLNNLGINKTLIKLAKQINDIYEDNKGNKTFPFEVVLIACCYEFLQHESDADKIREFALLFRDLIKSYAVRYNEGRKEYTVASLGELNEDLYSAERECHKVILFMTAFYTKSCLTSNSNPDDPINHIDDSNHTIHYQTDKILRNILQCMIDKELTDDCMSEIMKTHIARCDVHVRGGTMGNGNKFSDLVDELNDDGCLSSFCDDHKDKLKFEEGIYISKETKRMTSCTPILIDILLGIFNFALYAAYLKAIGKKLHIFLASGRSKIIFELGNDGTNDFDAIEAEDAVVSLGLHPNAVETNLTNEGQKRRPPQHIRSLDEGVSRVLKPLDQALITIRVNGDAVSSILEWRASDFFQRLYILRVSGIVEKPQEEGDYDYNIAYKNLEDASQRLLEAERKFDEAKEVHSETKEELKETKTTMASTKKLLEHVQRKVNHTEKAREEKQKRKEKEQQQSQEKSQKQQKMQEARDKLSDSGL